jgi:glycosyltransferase involved in cell wall biosynthesis
VSNTTRKVKNSALALNLFNEFPNLNKICIGKESSIFKNTENTIVEDLIAQEELFELMNDVRLVIIPSFYDSSPGILTEAISRGCNVLVSKNIGWNEYLDDKCVVNDFNDFNEWVSRVAHLTSYFESNDAFIQLISQSPTEILSLFENLDNKEAT